MTYSLLTLLLCFASPSPLPDPKIEAKGMLVWHSTATGDYEIHTMHLDGSHHVILNQAPKNIPDWEPPLGVKAPKWSPDGKRIVFFAYRGNSVEIVAMDADGQNRRRLTNGTPPAADPTWSPDGKHIAYRHMEKMQSGWQIYIMDADGKDPRRVVETTVRDRAPDWSPDGQWIVFSRGFGEKGPGGEDIYRVKIDGSGLERLTEQDGEDSLPTWSPDGRHIAYNASIEGKTDLYLMNADGTGKRALTTAGKSYAAAWSPDGNWLVFTSIVDENYDLYIIRSDGTGKRRVTVDPKVDSQPDWAALTH